MKELLPMSTQLRLFLEGSPEGFQSLDGAGISSGQGTPQEEREKPYTLSSNLIAAKR